MMKLWSILRDENLKQNKKIGDTTSDEFNTFNEDETINRFTQYSVIKRQQLYSNFTEEEKQIIEQEMMVKKANKKTFTRMTYFGKRKQP